MSQRPTYNGISFFLLSFIVISFSHFSSSQSDEAGAIWIPSQHKTGGRNGFSAKWLILHGTAGGTSAEAIGRWFQNPDAQASTHYVVDQNGVVVQCVKEADTAWANGRVETGAEPWWTKQNPNQVTISIEHVKSSTDNSNELTEKQKAASFRLIKSILQRHPGIQPIWATENTGITGHFSMSPVSRERCPGPFPWVDLFKDLNGQSQPICIGTVTATGGLNIRSRPSATSEIVGSLPKGRVINIQRREAGTGGDWFFLGDGRGYVSVTYIKVHIKQPSWCNGL